VTKEDGDVNGKFPPRYLQRKFGNNNIHFLKNNNLQLLSNGLRGTLLFIDSSIGLVHQYKGTHILYEVLFPMCDRGDFHIRNISGKDPAPTGYYLQQISGQLLGKLSPECQRTRKTFPYIEIIRLLTAIEEGKID